MRKCSSVIPNLGFGPLLVDHKASEVWGHEMIKGGMKEQKEGSATQMCIQMIFLCVCFFSEILDPLAFKPSEKLHSDYRWLVTQVINI